MNISVNKHLSKTILKHQLVYIYNCKKSEPNSLRLHNCVLIIFIILLCTCRTKKIKFFSISLLDKHADADVIVTQFLACYA